MADQVKSVSVKISTTGAEDAKLKIDQLAVKAEELKKINPEITPQIDSAKALLEARLLRDGIKRELAGSLNVGGSGGGPNFLQRAAMLGGGGSGSGSSGGLFSSLGGASGVAGFATSPVGIAAITAAVSALLPEIGGVVAGLAAATAGVGAFGVLAIPTFDKVKNAYTAINTAQKAYNQAAAINKEDPTAAHATAAAAALLKLKVAQESVSGSTRQAVTGIQSLVQTFEKMSAAFQPTVMKVFNDGLKIANQLLPSLKAPAQAAGTAIDGLLKQFSKFTQSKDFQNWLKSFDKLVGPSIAAIGHGIDLVITQIGKLITRFSARDVQHALNIFFDTIFGVITAIVKTIEFLMNSWDIASANIARTWRNIEIWFDEGAKAVIGAVKYLVDRVLGAFGRIVDGAAKAFGWVPGIGGKLKTAAKAFDDWKGSVDNSLTGAQKTLQGWVNHLEAAPKIAKFKGDITDLQAKIDAAEKHLSDPNLTKNRVARVEANISQLMSQLAAARKALAAINGATATTYVITSTSSIPGARGPGHPLGHAAGGWASGLIRVGELGPEVLQVPPGSYVHSNADSQRMFGGSTYNIHVSALVADRNTGGHIVEAIRKYEAGSGSGWRK